MSKGKGKIRIETENEFPRNYNVDRGEEITIKTQQEKPEVSSSGGVGIGFNISGPGEFIFILVCIPLVIALIISGIVYAVQYTFETYVIKSINPNYVTTFEKADIAKKERKDEADQKEKERNEISAEQKRKEPDKKIIEKRINAKGYDFSCSDYCIIENYVWACGAISGKLPRFNHGDGSYSKYDKYAIQRFPALIFSEDGGINYVLLWEERPVYAYDNPIIHYCSKISFSDIHNGLMETSMNCNGLTTYTYLWKTEDGGINWTEIGKK